MKITNNSLHKIQQKAVAYRRHDTRARKIWQQRRQILSDRPFFR